jgi:vesicle coat complex subunit
MGCIRIERILDYVIEPLRRGIKDPSPYVRKTSALCIAKIFDLNAEVSEDCGFLPVLQELLMTESNPMVVSNVVAALADIQELVPGLDSLRLDEAVAGRLVAVLTDCTEWGQVYLMDTLAAFSWVRLEDVERVIETVLPKLQHSNQAVVMSAVGLLLAQGLAPTSILPEEHQLRVVLQRKLSAPLVSLLSPPSPPEIQYAALRSINLLVRTHPTLFTDPGVLFCTYNDPQYVKLEKLEIIGLIVDERSIERVLPGLCEVATDVDPEIVKEAIKILARCAQSLPRWLPRILQIFSELLETNLPVVLQQITLNLVPLVRTCDHGSLFPLIEAFYFSRLEATWEALQGGDEAPQAAFIWILAEFTNENYLQANCDEDEESNASSVERNLNFFSDQILACDSFSLEGIQFQREALQAALKIFVSNASTSHAAKSLQLAQKAVNLAFQQGGSVDVMDLSRIYERLLNENTSSVPIEVTTTKTSPTFNPVIDLDDWGLGKQQNEQQQQQQQQEQQQQETPFNLQQLFTEAEYDHSLHFSSSSFSPSIIDRLLKQFTKLSAVFHQLPDEFVSARQIVVKSEPGQSPLEHSLKSLTETLPLTDQQNDFDLPVAYAKLLRSNRPAVANLLDLSYDQDLKNKDSPNTTNTTETKSPAHKYANLLDLLD